ncbi:putative glucose-6-phosphate 1-epimerase [Pseudolycoriella hygida]|uniref:Galactose mutarotase n=1 Tax=Pseudolycoriella hygida TaxID=35572 RepID=A0A9Q0N8I5_9DIPT|nr:putative glucose-6-phosphate 1-epimerase [Pseudolycoriella hygida]
MSTQFGPWSFGPQHGFARITRWALERPPERLHNGDVEALFSLMDNDFTRSMWNYPFRITYRLILREKELHFHIGVYNPSKDLTFSFNLLLHTYLKVPDVRRCQITGLHGCTFIDKTRDGLIYQEGRDVVTINEFCDRIYQHTPQEHIITNVVSGRKMRLQKYNFPDTVIWNPWADQAREIADFGDDEYPNMVCVESGHVSSPVILLPGTAFEASQILQNKIQIYEEWVKRLLEEISTLVECIQEMENQTARSLDALTQNLNMSRLPDERTNALQNDLSAIVEIIRRARASGKWNTDGIKLEYLTFSDIFGDHQQENDKNPYLELDQPGPKVYTFNIEVDAKHFKATNSDMEMHHGDSTARDIHDIDTEHANRISDLKANNVEQRILFDKMKNRETELLDQIHVLEQENRRLMKCNLDTRVLVEEVATRHDEIKKYKNEIMSLEEQLKTQDKSMCYRDEIIKELRKDCKKLSSSTPPMSSKIFQSTGTPELSKNSYNRKTNITNRLLEIFNFVQSSLQPIKNLIAKHSVETPAVSDQVVQENSQMDSPLSDDGSLFTNSHIDKLTSQMVALQKEIDAKNQLLREKDAVITSLIECGILKDRELSDLRNRISSMECYSYTSYNDNDVRDELIVNLKDNERAKICEINELKRKIESNSSRSEETVNNLRDALDIHIKTINQQQLGNNHLESKIRDLELYISNIDRNYILLQEKYRKLELENCHVSNKDQLSIETYILSEQICDLFNENIQYEKKIDLLHDDNLYLRGEMYLWSQDYNYLEDKFLVYLTETRNAYANISSNETKICETNEENIAEELRNYKNSAQDFKIFKDSIEELSSQLNILSNESKFNLKLIEDSTLLLESFQHLQQENENLKVKHELSLKQIQIVESEANELKSENAALKEDLKSQKEKIEEVKRIESDKNAVIEDLSSKNIELTNKLCEHRHQRDADELLVSHQEYQKAKEMSSQLTNEVSQQKILITDLNQEILRQSLALDKQKDDRYTMSKQLESAFEITEKLKFTIDSNLKSISHLQEENEKLKQELNEHICTIEKVQADQNTKELEMMNKNDSLQQTVEEHIKARRVSDKSLLDLTVQNQKLNQQNEDLISEIVHLKDEIHRLKAQVKSLESNSSLMNDMHGDVEHVRTQLEKLLVNITVVSREEAKFINKVFLFQDKEGELTSLRKQNSLLNQQNATQANNQRTLQNKLNKVIEKYKEIKEEYDLLKNNYEKLCEIKEKLTHSLNVSTNAMDELKEREELSNQLLSKQDEHIRTLLHDRSALKIKMDQMHRDMIILNSRPSSETVARKTKMIKYRSVPSLTTPDDTLQSIQKIRKKIYETRSFWQNGMEEAFK